MRPSASRAAILILGVFFSFGCEGGRDPAVSLTMEERQKITELVLSVAEDPDDAAESARAELWTILKRHGMPPARQLGRMKARFRAIAEGHRFFWRDAREALKNHRMVKSAERARWEAGLTQDGWLSPKQRERFDDLMQHIVREEPMPANHGVEVALSETMVEAIADSWNEPELERSISELLVPPK